MVVRVCEGGGEKGAYKQLPLFLAAMVSAPEPREPTASGARVGGTVSGQWRRLRGVWQRTAPPRAGAAAGAAAWTRPSSGA